MSIICKTGCGSQVVYQNIEFTDGFVLQIPHNLDESIHFCPIFHDEYSFLSDPKGGTPFDSYPFRDNSYGDEIYKIDELLVSFDHMITSKNQNLSYDDILNYKLKLQSSLIAFPLVGLYTDVTGGLEGYSVPEEYFEDHLSSLLGDQITPTSSFYLTLGSEPLTALKKIYYILEGKSENFKKIKILEKEILEHTLDEQIYPPQSNPFEIQLIDAKKQLKKIEEKLESKPDDEDLKKWRYFYQKLIDGVKHGEESPSVGGGYSHGIKDNLLAWYENLEETIKDEKMAMELGIPYDQYRNLCLHSWDYLSRENREALLELSDVSTKDHVKIINLSFKEIKESFPELIGKFKENDIGDDHFAKNIKQLSSTFNSENETLFDIRKIKFLIEKNKKIDEIKKIRDLSEILNDEDNLDISNIENVEIQDTLDMEKLSELLSHDHELNHPHVPDMSKQRDVESFLQNNSIVHISNMEQKLRELIITSLYDGDIIFLKKHFKQIWEEIELTKIKQSKNIHVPQEKTELDYATIGHLITIMKNKETKKRAKSQNIESFSELIIKCELILPYRNQLDHSRDLIDGDLHAPQKMIVVGICVEIDTLCVNILYR
jgi:hypothetical protein